MVDRVAATVPLGVDADQVAEVVEDRLEAEPKGWGLLLGELVHKGREVEWTLKSEAQRTRFLFYIPSIHPSTQGVCEETVIN